MTELLADILNNPRAGKAIENSRIVLLWNQCVSAEIAKQTEPVKVSNRILVVETKSPVWAQELNFLKKDIMDLINQRAGYPAIRDIRFKAGG